MKLSLSLVKICSFPQHPGPQEINQSFRAIRRALWECKHAAVGIFTDTNSSVVNLAPSRKRDPLVCITLRVTGRRDTISMKFHP